MNCGYHFFLTFFFNAKKLKTEQQKQKVLSSFFILVKWERPKYPLGGGKTQG